MKSWLLLLALLLLPGGSILALILAWRRSRSGYVSPAWRIDAERRAWGIGIDQACVRKWPINKVTNEAAAFQAQRLRRRA